MTEPLHVAFTCTTISGRRGRPNTSAYVDERGCRGGLTPLRHALTDTTPQLNP
jgi:hypothetical protein